MNTNDSIDVNKQVPGRNNYQNFVSRGLMLSSIDQPKIRASKIFLPKLNIQAVDDNIISDRVSNYSGCEGVADCKYGLRHLKGSKSMVFKSKMLQI